ncbi:MAG: DUF86 domain-containing protein [Phormidesmis sp.]
MRRDSASLLDMYQAGQQVLAFTQGITLRELQDDDMRLSAVLYEIIVIGEATTRLSPDFRANHPQLPWKKMSGMRNILVHQYDEVNFDLLWDAIQFSIPEMLGKTAPLLPEEPVT